MICYKELAHVVLEAETSLDLQLATGYPGELMVFKSKARSQPGDRQAEGAHSPLLSLFCSIQVSSGLNEAHPCCGGQFASLGLSIQMSVSSRNTQNQV